jgi:anti-sigma B factor antagonist
MGGAEWHYFQNASRRSGAKAVIMNSQERLFEIEQDHQTLILSPIANLSELELSSFDDAIQAVVRQLESLGFRNILLDFTGTDYYGSTALGFFIKLWKRVRGMEGNMVFCNVSPHEREVLELTRLDHLWKICATREEALQFLQSGDG